MIKHYSKNGKEIKDITGIRVERSAYPEIYEVMDRLNREREKDEKKDS